MFEQFFARIGSLAGDHLGGGIFSTIGRYTGKWLGNYLENPKKLSKSPKFYEIKHNYAVKNIKNNFSFNKACHGEAIPLTFGISKVNGKIIWAEQVKEARHDHTDKKYFTNEQLKSINHTISCEYYFSFALSICEGEITEIGRVWANDQLINLGDYNFRLYLGSEEQLPDSLILAVNQNSAPAFKDLAYIVFEDLPLADFGDSIPFFSFEIIRKPNIKSIVSVEDLVKSMVMIPGSGEYVYDTIIQYKINQDQSGIELDRSVINSHNHLKLPNAIHSLNQLQLTCNNVEWIAPVACWFGDNLDAANCRIRPGIEFNEQNITYSETWQVGPYSRDTAMIVSRDEFGNPVYGGSINDTSLLRYLEELRGRGLKIMFYPMFLMDVTGKPWRGHLTGSPIAVAEFFTKDQGYNEFILHYANLVKNHVDAFVIGSELIGLTKVSEGQIFPAVAELVKLTQSVKQIVGDVKVLYAADWSEYHHADGGWYNLDPLWSSPYLDYVGIDAYFPVTRSTSSNILADEILKGWQSGEGYDFYYDQHGNKQILQAAYAWKNVRYWWENVHYNPDGQQTSWQPRMKKVWFTEFGFPSIDKSTNQPNVFFDPKCSDGGVPRYSTGETNFSIQRKAIKMFIEFWQTQEYVEQLFLWTWDARPYPAWPHMNIWQDGNLWEKGHWINNKFGAASLSAILLELSNRANINASNVEVKTLDESVEGAIFKNQQSIMEAINIFRIAHFFDLTTICAEQIKFVKRGQTKPYDIDSKLLVKLNDNSFFEKREIAKEQILSKLEIYFIDHADLFRYGYCQLNNENFSNRNTLSVQIPLCMSTIHAETLGKLILKNALIEDQIIRFRLPLNTFKYEPTDAINLYYRNFNYQIRIISIEIKELTIEIIGIFDDAESYSQLAVNYDLEFNYSTIIEEKLLIIDLPVNLSDNSSIPQLVAYLASEIDTPLYGSLTPNNTQAAKIANLKTGACIGRLVNFTNSAEANMFLIDDLSEFALSSSNFAHSVTTGWNLILIGKEIISFHNWQDLGNNCFKINNLIRGKFCTDEYINSHHNGEEFVLLSQKPNFIPVAEQLIGQDIYFKTRNSAIKINFLGRSKQPSPPYITLCEIQNGVLLLAWQIRTTAEDDWRGAPIIPEYKFIIDISANNVTSKFTTENQHLNINITQLSLSGEATISIIAKDEFDNQSRPHNKILAI